MTWVDGNVGLSGVVSAANSLVGSIANDTVGTVGRPASNLVSLLTLPSTLLFASGFE